jgi:succinate dehydrogenase/fumarate reductase flavoprotein subunit
MQIPETILTTDVLVIGAGFAGCFAAKRARELGERVLIVEQGKSGFVGSSSVGTHMTRVVLPEDNVELALEGTVLESDYMVDQDYAEGALRETWDRFQEFLEVGADYRRDDAGKIRWYLKDTRWPEHKQRCALWEPIGSYRHLLKVKAAALRLGAEVLDRVVITDFLVTNGEVVGAIGIDRREGNFYVLRAKAVVIATGGSAGAALGRNPSLTGDGVAMALRAGAELRNMEFGKVEVSGTVPLKPGGPHWVYTFVGPEEKEVTITNAKGEEFMEKYEFLHRLPGRKYYGAPWNIHLDAMFQEFKEGKGPVYVDWRAPNKADRMREFLGSFWDESIKSMRLSGANLTDIKYELGIGRGSAQNGGIRIDPSGKTSIPGLFSGGIVSDMCCAPHYSIPANIMGSHITGRRAGASAAEYALSIDLPAIDDQQVARLKEYVYAPLNREQGTTEEAIRLSLIKAWVNIDIRDEARLTTAVRELQEIEENASELMASDYRELAKCRKIVNQVQCGQAVALAALARQETRMEHVRQDFPLTDNKDWLKWVVVQRVGQSLQTRLEDIPIERWKYRPERTTFNRLQPRKGVGS